MSKNDSNGRLISSMCASAIAEFLTVPFDVAKVRLQLNHPQFKYDGFLDCIYKMKRQEGILSLWKGLTPALVRQVCYNSMIMVIYNPIYQFYKDLFHSNNYIVKLLAAGNSGAISIALFNWTEVIKTNIQANTCVTNVENISKGSQYTMTDAFKNVYNSCGMRGFLFGIQPNIYRAFFVNGIGLGTYEEIKEGLIPIFGDNNVSYLLSSISTSIISTIFTTPIDVIKTRMMDCNREGYKSVTDATIKMYANEGFKSFFKGLVPICIRRIIWGSAFFLCYEGFYSYGWRETKNR